MLTAAGLMLNTSRDLEAFRYVYVPPAFRSVPAKLRSGSSRAFAEKLKETQCMRRRSCNAAVATTRPYAAAAHDAPRYGYACVFQFITKPKRNDVSSELGGKFVHNCRLHEV
jgi:hypothetical protein